MWIPRTVRPQVGAILRQLLAAATRHARATRPNDEAEIAHLLFLHAPQLLFRQPPPAEAGDRAPAASAIAKGIRQRLTHARAGRWITLACELHDDLEGQHFPSPH